MKRKKRLVDNAIDIKLAYVRIIHKVLNKYKYELCISLYTEKT